MQERGGCWEQGQSGPQALLTGRGEGLPWRSGIEGQECDLDESVSYPGEGGMLAGLTSTKIQHQAARAGWAEEPTEPERLGDASVGAGAPGAGMYVRCSAGVRPVGQCQVVLRIMTSQIFLFRKTQAWDHTALAGLQPKS